MVKQVDVLIIGAGLAGISAALNCQSRGIDAYVVEASDRAGGRVASDVIDGFICDRGFQLINSQYPALKELDVIQDIDFIKVPRIIEVSIGRNRHALGDPRVAPWTILDRATGTIPEKLALLQVILKGAKENQSLGQLLSRCGSTYNRVLEPFLRGVFLTDPVNVDAIYGLSIIKSFVNGKPGVPQKGIGQLPLALAKRISNIEYNTTVNSIQGQLVQTSQGEIYANKIIVATDATTATQLLGLNNVVKMAGCTTWYHTSDINPSGVARLLVDGLNRGPIYNSIVMSDISSDYAPKGQHLISTTTGIQATESDVRRHLAIIWGMSTHDWQLVAKYSIPAALPVHDIGRSLTQKIQLSENLYVVGDHRSVPSQQGALFSGKLAAELILN